MRGNYLGGLARKIAMALKKQKELAKNIICMNLSIFTHMAIAVGARNCLNWLMKNSIGNSNSVYSKA